MLSTLTGSGSGGLAVVFGGIARGSVGIPR